MKTVHLQSAVGSDGVLALRIPFESRDAGRTVSVTVEPSARPAREGSADAWHRFLDETYGSCASLGLERPDQGHVEERDATERRGCSTPTRAPILERPCATASKPFGSGHSERGCGLFRREAELFFGAARSFDPPRSRATQDRFLDQFASLAFDDRCAHEYGVLRAWLANAGTPIGTNDMLIAATAVANGVTLVTHNTAEFGRVPGLQLEDWEI